MKRAASCLLACLSLLATSAQAVPVSFQFTTVVDQITKGLSSDGEPVAVPAPFADDSKVLGTSITGSFTVETDVDTFLLEDLENDEFIPVGLLHWNPVISYDLTVAGQQFSFVGARPPAETGIQESGFTVIDLPQPRSDPLINYDLYQLDTSFGAGQLGAPFDGLQVFASLIYQNRDLSVIQSSDLLTGLTLPTSWDFFFTFLEPETFRDYQVHGVVTDLHQVVEAPEPATGALFAVGLGMLGMAVRGRRRQLPAASFITR